ncbi:hypothetical protein M5C99_14595 [Acidovorax sp. NCPPB 2350]|nr:hypothetical protein M5C99_14595 [Acidovorax sp. NCPPB 2350]
MTAKRTNKRAPQQPAKQSHYYEVVMAIEITANSFFAQLGYESMPENLKTSMIAGIIFPKAPYENSQRYFDFSGMTPLQVEETLQKLRGSMPIDLLIKGDVLAVYRLIKKSFPPVKLA